MTETPAPYTVGDPGDETPPRIGYTAAEVEEVTPGEYMPRGGIKPDIRPGETPDQAMTRRRRERRERRLAGLESKAPASEPLEIEDCEMPSSRARHTPLTPMQASAMRPTESEMAAAIRAFAEAWRPPADGYGGEASVVLARLQARAAAADALMDVAARLPQPGPFAAQERNGEVR